MSYWFNRSPYPEFANNEDGNIQEIKPCLGDFEPSQGVVDPSQGVGIGSEHNEFTNDDILEDEEEDLDYLIDEDNMIYDVQVDMEEFKTYMDNDIGEESLEEHSEDDDNGLDVDLDDFDSHTDKENDPPLMRALRKERKKQNRRKDAVVEPFFVGQQFANRDEIKAIMKKLAVDSRRQLKVLRNDPIRFRVVYEGFKPEFDCGDSSKGSEVKSQENASKRVVESQKIGALLTKPTTKGRNKPTTCPWVLYVSNLNREGSWVVKTYINEHTCLQTREIQLCTVLWLAKEFESTIAVNPNVPLKSLQDLFQKKHQIQLSMQKVFRAKTMAKEKIDGHYRAQYAILKEYCQELVLTVVGIDSKNGIYPVAYALVEAKTKNSWCWFLECLGHDLDLTSNSNFTFISDRQKGIIPALQQVFPNTEHKYCLRHVHENMMSRWRGQLFKNLLWKCATSTTVPYFEKAMKEVESSDRTLFQWLREIPPKHWCRAYFTGRATSDVLLNNLCEVFNKQLVEGRDKPVINCLEFIREYLMKRIVVVHKLISKCEGPLTLNGTNLFKKIKVDAVNMNVIWNGQSKYQVNGPSHE